MKKRRNKGLGFVTDKQACSIFGGRLMVIETKAMLKLINKYFPN
jgi:hypothetical protein